MRGKRHNRKNVNRTCYPQRRATLPSVLKPKSWIKTQSQAYHFCFGGIDRLRRDVGSNQASDNEAGSKSFKEIQRRLHATGNPAKFHNTLIQKATHDIGSEKAPTKRKNEIHHMMKPELPKMGMERE